MYFFSKFKLLKSDLDQNIKPQYLRLKENLYGLN